MAKTLPNRKSSEKDFMRIRLRLFEYAATHSLEELLQKTLDELEVLTQSSIGFYHFVEKDQKTLSLQAWSTRTVKKFCKAEGKGMHYDIDQAGVWVECVHQRKPVIHNDYASLPHRKGLPSGHATVVRELVVPLLKHDRIVSILGVGNKSTDYTQEDIEIVSFLADVAWEIVEQKRMEEVLQKSEERYRALFDHMSDGVAIYRAENDGEDFILMELNKSAEGIENLKKEDLIGKSARKVFPGIENFGLFDVFKRVWKTGKPEHHPISLYKDERISGWRDNFVCKLPSGEIVTVYSDETERRRAEEALRSAHDELEIRVKERTAELEKRAEQLGRLSSELTLSEQRERSRIAKILHDHLQQLLVAARINQEICINEIESPAKPMAGRVLDLIDECIREMRSLNTELAPPVLNSGDLSSSLEWLVRWMYKNQGFEVKMESEAPVVLGRKDIAILLFQSIRELLLNVIKHAGVKSAEVKAETNNNGELRIDVIDRGVGCNPEKSLEDAGYDQKFGLISIRERLTNLGGRFEMESRLNRGCRVTLVIPLNEKRSVEKERRDLNRETQGKSISAPADMQRFTGKIRVMLVDDHPVMREGLSRMLDSHSDIEVVGEASDGEEAVDLARRIVPDVILMDVRMPNMDGLEATRIISSELPHIRIIGLSMYDKDDQAEAMLNNGASAYCSKSDKTYSLLAAIRGEDQ